MCGEVVKSLPLLLHRIVGDDEERFRACSAACWEAALRSPYVQTDPFGRDLRLWTRSVQVALELTEPPEDEARRTDAAAGAKGE